MSTDIIKIQHRILSNKSGKWRKSRTLAELAVAIANKQQQVPDADTLQSDDTHDGDDAA